MKHLKVFFFALATLTALEPIARASTVDLYDFALHTSTGVSGDWQDVTTNDPTTIIDSTSMIYSDKACCGDASGGTTAGLGTLNYTFKGLPGTYTVSLYFDYDVATPNFNEFGTVNNGGSAQTGISYQLFNGNSAGGNIVLFGATGVAGNEKYGAANGTNSVSGTTDNFLGSCTSSGCNSDVAMALTYTFTLGANQEAVLTAISSLTNPGGFSLEATHPVDANNSSTSSLFVTGDYVVQTIMSSNPIAPEPATFALMGMALVVFSGIHQSRKSGKTK